MIMNDITAVEYAFLNKEYIPTRRLPANHTNQDEVNSLAFK